MNDELIVVGTFSDRIEAELAASARRMRQQPAKF
jgi:hypothetical protein